MRVRRELVTAMRPIGDTDHEAASGQGSCRSEGVSPTFATSLASATPVKLIARSTRSGNGRPRGTSSLVTVASRQPLGPAQAVEDGVGDRPAEARVERDLDPGGPDLLQDLDGVRHRPDAGIGAVVTSASAPRSRR